MSVQLYYLCPAVLKGHSFPYFIFRKNPRLKPFSLHFHRHADPPFPAPIRRFADPRAFHFLRFGTARRAPGAAHAAGL